MSGPADGETPFRYKLELTPSQLKVTYDALRARLDAGDAGPEVAALLREILVKLPDSAQIGSIRLAGAGEPPAGEFEAPTELPGDEPPDDPSGEPPPVVA